MPRAEKGTQRKARIWLDKSKPRPDDEVELSSFVNNEHTVLASWTVADIQSDPAWEAHVFELAQSNADERGCTTSYAIRQLRGGQQRAVYEIRCRASDAEEGSDFDGSPGMLVQGLYRQNERLLSHVLTQTNAAIAPLMKSLEVAQARNASLEAERAKLADELHKVRTQVLDLVEKARSNEPMSDETFENRLTKLFFLAKQAGFVDQN